jgi:hypothetical protein
MNVALGATIKGKNQRAQSRLLTFFLTFLLIHERRELATRQSEQENTMG